MRDQPSGTLTFLFSDIEASTRHWEAHREQMDMALRRHDEILRNLIERNNGHVFKTIGDAFCAAFTAAPDAVQASLDIQKQIRAEPWELPSPLCVRIALHTGNAELRDNDYFGPPLNRVARLESLAYGGQTILSLVTEELVRDHLPDGASLVELGRHRLKDLTRPETVYELRFDEQPESFPPPRSLDSHPHNLPLQPTSLVGREQELETLKTQIRENRVRLLTLVGPGGIGKTRMSLQIAADLIEDFPDGAFVVDLAPVRNPDHVANAIAVTLRLHEAAEIPLGDQLREWLSGRRIMLVLDNFEQVIDGAGYLATLLASCADLKLIVTSRQPLRLRGEQVYHVPPLALPEAVSETDVSIERLSQYDAVRLFIDRAVDVNPSFMVTNENAPAVAAICVRLDGLPLALELAAARLSMLTPETLLHHLGQRLAILTGGPRDLPARQQTLRNTIDWSYDLLTESERSLFAALSIFYGGFTVEAAEAVCTTLGFTLPDILEITQSLVEKSLVAAMPLPDGDSRFLMLETIREYGRDHIEKEEKLFPLARAHAEYYLRFAEEVGDDLEGANPRPILAKIDRDAENIRRAVHFFSLKEEPPSALRLLTALGRYWQQRGILAETRSQLDSISATANKLPTGLVVRALSWNGLLAREQGDYETASNLLRQAIELAREHNDFAGFAFALHESGWNAYRRQDVEAGRALFEKCREVATRIEDDLMAAKASFGIATLDLLSGDTENLRHRLEQARDYFHDAGHLRLETQALGNLGLLAYQSERYEEAVEIWLRLMSIYEQLADAPSLSLVLNDLAEAYMRLGDPASAMTYFERLSSIAGSTANERWRILSEVGRAEATLAMQDAESAMKASEEAIALLRRYGIESGIEIGQCMRVRGDIYRALGRLSEAAESYENAARILASTAAADEHKRAIDGLKSVRPKERDSD